ncbi:hypothetical protein MCHI_002753 [Candidatus Magnetoovum chiemensis]|nr:hypothetical protein MCHI_002753 [Candidatus Magnetoovum chiemensis]
MSKFSRGSPIPIRTIFVTVLCVVFARVELSDGVCRSTSRRTEMTCSNISKGVRFLLNPIEPVRQNLHPIAQPACEEIHSVRRSLSGIRTLSIVCLSSRLKRYFFAPSDESCFLTIFRLPM